MKAYKLVRKRRDGTLSPLFIDRKSTLWIGKLNMAEAHRPNGFAYRPGWHCSSLPHAPHLKMNLASGEKRVWCEVEIFEYATEVRPESQGGMWYLAKWMKVVRELSTEDVAEINKE